MMNKKVNTARPELHPVPVKSPWFHLGIDFIGPYSPPSSNGNKYVLTVCDYFTKFVWAKPLPSKEAKNVAQALRELFFLFGIPQVITTDQGREFKNTLNAELTTTLGIQHRLTTAYHPQANGLDKRWNQTLKNTIVKFIDGKPDEWDKLLPEICYSYNTAVQEVRILDTC